MRITFGLRSSGRRGIWPRIPDPTSERGSRTRNVESSLGTSEIHECCTKIGGKTSIKDFGEHNDIQSHFGKKINESVPAICHKFSSGSSCATRLKQQLGKFSCLMSSVQCPVPHSKSRWKVYVPFTDFLCSFFCCDRRSIGTTPPSAAT